MCEIQWLSDGDLLALMVGPKTAQQLLKEVNGSLAALLLNVLVLALVIRLVMNLDPETRAEQGLWLVMLCVAPPANALAILPRRSVG